MAFIGLGLIWRDILWYTASNRRTDRPTYRQAGQQDRAAVEYLQHCASHNVNSFDSLLIPRRWSRAEWFRLCRVRHHRGLSHEHHLEETESRCDPGNGARTNELICMLGEA